MKNVQYFVKACKILTENRIFRSEGVHQIKHKERQSIFRDKQGYILSPILFLLIVDEGRGMVQLYMIFSRNCTPDYQLNTSQSLDN